MRSLDFSFLLAASRRRLVSAVILASMAGASLAHAKLHLKVSASSVTADAFAKWTTGKTFDQITTYNDPNATRSAVDLVLVLQALKTGGLDFDFEVVNVPNNARARIEVIQGGADIDGETVWDYVIDADAKSVLRTDPVIRDGKFEKGIYVSPTNEAILKVTTLEQLQQFVGATVASWDVDVKTLQAMKPKGVETAPKTENLFVMIDRKRADFTLMELSSQPDLSNESGGVKLIPIPGVKVALKGSRSWIVSKTSPNSAQIYDALVKGIKAMNDDKRINRAYRESGFLNPKMAEWKRLF
jgi:hypothetical protein